MSVRSLIAVFAVAAIVGRLAFDVASKGSSDLSVGDAAPTHPLLRVDGGAQSPHLGERVALVPGGRS